MTEQCWRRGGLTKRFGKVQALAGLDLWPRPGGVSPCSARTARQDDLRPHVATLLAPTPARSRRRHRRPRHPERCARSSASPASTPPSRRR